MIEPVILQSDDIILKPLCASHRDDLLKAASDGELWKLWYTSVPSKQNIEQYIEQALLQQQQGRSLPFAVIDKKSSSLVGTTRYCNIETNHRRLEIGYTWYAKSTQRTGVNTQAKYLLLLHAFEQLNCIAVEFRTHWFNHASRNAILRLGAKQDGVLRNHMIMPDGSYRDTVVYSITLGEWPTVKRHLEFKLTAYFQPK